MTRNVFDKIAVHLCSCTGKWVRLSAILLVWWGLGGAASGQSSPVDGCASSASAPDPSQMKLAYQYCVPSPSSTDGYAPNGNLLSYKDTVNGNWGFMYDSLNRLTGAASRTTGVGPYQDLMLAMQYDSFGNRQSQTSGIAQIIPTIATPVTTPDNRTSTFTVANGPQTVSFDGAGNVLDNGVVGARYDGDGRVCATQSDALMGRVTLYLYDADGNRVAKGHSASNPNVLACSTGGPDFVADLTYAIGRSGEQVSEFAGDNNSWNHTNVFASGQLVATYDQAGLHYHVDDALGSRRLQVDGDGRAELQCNNLPFGESTQTIPQCSPLSAGVTDATEHHFTGKERDTESGLDYFGARYYGSSMGRFMSPDSLGGDPMNPQSWNLYGYVQNNPIKNTDPDGHDCVVQTRTSNTTETVSSSAGNCDNVSVGDGQTKTYVAGTVTGIQAGADGHSIDIGYTAYGSNGDNSTSVTNASAAPIPDNTNLAYNWGNNAQGYQQLGAASQAVKGATVGVAAVYGGVACAIACPGAAAAVGRWGLQRLAMGASSPVLLNLINRLYQAQDEIPGGTAGAVRNEVTTGEFINGGHSIKAAEMITALTKLINSGELSGSDQTIAGHIISDLKNSLGR